MMNWRDKPSALPRLKFSTIWGEKTTTQQAIDIELPGFHQYLNSFVSKYGDLHIPTNTTNSLDVQVKTLRWRKHDLDNSDAGEPRLCFAIKVQPLLVPPQALLYYQLQSPPRKGGGTERNRGVL